MERPLFRTDLVCKAVDADGQRWVDVTDPGSGATFRFYELEYAIACAMDGTRDRGEIATWAQAELGIEPARSELETVISTLDSLGYLTELTDVEVAASSGTSAPRVAAGRSADSTAAQGADFAAAGTSSTAGQTPPERDDVELGASGKSPIYGRPAGRSIESADIELGLPGKAAAGAPAVVEATSSTGGGDLELGAPGQSTTAAGEDDYAAVDDQPTNVSDISPLSKAPRTTADDVSVDLSQQFVLDAGEVKEAVRRSRVMEAVEAPADEDATTSSADEAAADDDESLAGEDLERTRTGTEPIAIESKRSRPIVLPEAPARDAEPVVPAARAGRPVAAAAAAPQAAAKSAAKATAVEAPARRASIINVVVLVLVLALLAAAGTYAYLMYFKDRTGTVAPPAVTKVEPVRPAPPPPPPPPSATLAMTDVEPSVVVAPRTGKVAWIAEAGTALEAGAPVAKLVGADAMEKELERSRERLKVYQDSYDQAAAKSNKAAMKVAEGHVKRKQVDLERLEAKMALLVAAAPVAGGIEPVVQVGARVNAGAEVATITPVGRAIATFPTTAVTQAVGTPVTVQAKDDPSRQATCEVSEIGDAGAIVRCPADGPLKGGDEIIVAR